MSREITDTDRLDFIIVSGMDLEHRLNDIDCGWVMNDPLRRTTPRSFKTPREAIDDAMASHSDGLMDLLKMKHLAMSRKP